MSTTKQFSQVVDMDTIKVDSDNHAYLDLKDIVDNETVFVKDGKLTTLKDDDD